MDGLRKTTAGCGQQRLRTPNIPQVDSEKLLLILWKQVTTGEYFLCGWGYSPTKGSSEHQAVLLSSWIRQLVKCLGAVSHSERAHLPRKVMFTQGFITLVMWVSRLPLPSLPPLSLSRITVEANHVRVCWIWKHLQKLQITLIDFCTVAHGNALQSALLARVYPNHIRRHCCGAVILAVPEVSSTITTDQCNVLEWVHCAMHHEKCNEGKNWLFWPERKKSTLWMRLIHWKRQGREFFVPFCAYQCNFACH